MCTRVGFTASEISATVETEISAEIPTRFAKPLKFGSDRKYIKKAWLCWPHAKSFTIKARRVEVARDFFRGKSVFALFVFRALDVCTHIHTVFHEEACHFYYYFFPFLFFYQCNHNKRIMKYFFLYKRDNGYVMYLNRKKKELLGEEFAV